MSLSGWGRSHRARVEAARPERRRALIDAVAEAEAPLLARGGGRSYGDCATISGGRVILTERLDRILDFDPATGQVVVEPGVTFADLLDAYLPRGWLVPVAPGTAFATIGGAVANDVHGKNHEHAGSFGDHVRWCELLLASGETVRISPRTRPDLFKATIGGIGLTGILLAVCFRLVRVPSNAVWTRESRVADLHDFLAQLAAAIEQPGYSVGWIDALAGGRHLGRGILERAWPAERDLDEPAPTPRRMPFDLPGGLLNRFTVGAFNEAYWRRIPADGRDGKARYDRFFFPLDSIDNWNRVYGKRGFHQFQCVLPADRAEAGIRQMLQAVQRAGNASPLAVLKAMRGRGRGYLSFPDDGFTLALDLPARPATRDLLAALETLTLDHGGRIYLAKDSALSPAGLAAMYPELDKYRQVLAEVDPDRRFGSDMATRLRLRGDH
ncbi:MAG: FAD-binding oxidoreductase [Alphaproteobacteria bacterium]